MMIARFPPGKAWSKNISAVSYIHLCDRPGFKMAIHRHGERWFLYSAHFWTSGLSIIEITNPEEPKFVRFIPGPENTWTLQIQIADGRMITSLERIAEG